MATVRRSMPVPVDVAGSADIYPQHTAVVIADPRLIYSPRPAYLSLNAHTLKLATLNAEHLRVDPPQNILFQVLHWSRSVNNRHPATADGPSWPEILTRYDATERTVDFLVLQRRPQPLPYRFDHIETHVVRWDEEIVIPGEPNKLIWAQLRVQPSVLGWLTKLLYKSPHVVLEQTFTNGQTKRYQIVPSLGEAGFLLSPLVDDTPSFLRLLQDRLPLATSDRTVASIKVMTSHRALWSEDVEITFSQLNIDDGRPRALPASLEEVLLFHDLSQNILKCMFAPSEQSAPDVEGRILMLHAPCLTSLDVPADAAGVRVSYGLSYFWKAGEPDPEGADFRMRAIGGAGTLMSEVSRFLDPVNQRADRGEHTASLAWSPGTVKSIEIEFGTGPTGNPIYDHTYVSQVQFLRGSQ
jgi:hypothetical protein